MDLEWYVKERAINIDVHVDYYVITTDHDHTYLYYPVCHEDMIWLYKVAIYCGLYAPKAFGFHGTAACIVEYIPNWQEFTIPLAKLCVVNLSYELGKIIAFDIIVGNRNRLQSIHHGNMIGIVGDKLYIRGCELGDKRQDRTMVPDIIQRVSMMMEFNENESKELEESIYHHVEIFSEKLS